MQVLRRSFALAVLLLGAPFAAAQQEIAWTELLDVHGFGEAPMDVAVDAAGNVHVAGATEAAAGFGSSDWYVQKIDPNGATLWAKTLDGGTSGDDHPFALALGAGGDVYVAGTIDQTALGLGLEIAVARFDASGAHQWTRTFHGAPGGGEDQAFDVCVDAQGNVVAVGRSTVASGTQDVAVVSWTPAGALAYATLVDGSLGGDDQGIGIVALPSGAVAFTALLNSTLTNSGDGGIGRVDPTGQLAWLFELDGGNPDDFDLLNGVAVAANGDVLVAGRIQENLLGNRALTARYAPDGVELWRELFDWTPGLGTELHTVVEGADGTIWVGGTANTGNASSFSLDGVVLRYDPVGTLLSSDNVNFPPEATLGLGLVLGSAGQAFLTGFTFNAQPFALFVAQFDAEGALTWKTRFTTQGSLGDDFRAAAGMPGGDLVLVSRSLQDNHIDGFDGLTVRMDLSESPQGYCLAKTSSVGCAPRMTFAGLSSSAAASGFTLRAEGMINQKFGLFAYSLSGAATTPFGGGLLCVAGPVRRSPPRFTNGNLGPDDCSGALALDWNEYATGVLGGAPDPLLSIPGSTVFVQAWGRDTGFAPPNAVQLSNALRYVVLP